MTDPTEIEELLHKVEIAQDRIGGWLLRRGWDTSSLYPDCIWRWHKEIDGKVLAVDRDSAVGIERALSND